MSFGLLIHVHIHVLVNTYTHRHKILFFKKRYTVNLNGFQTFISMHVQTPLLLEEGEVPIPPAYICRVSNLTHVAPLNDSHRCGERTLVFI